MYEWFYQYKRIKYAHIIASLKAIEKEKEKNFEKSIDKSKKTWYNNNVIKGWEHYPNKIKKEKR